MGNHEGATAAMEVMDRKQHHVHVHPRALAAEARKVQELGEVVYMRRAGRDALDWIRAHPGAFIGLTASRVASLVARPPLRSPGRFRGHDAHDPGSGRRLAELPVTRRTGAGCAAGAASNLTADLLPRGLHAAIPGVCGLAPRAPGRGGGLAPDRRQAAGRWGIFLRVMNQSLRLGLSSCRGSRLGRGGQRRPPGRRSRERHPRGTTPAPRRHGSRAPRARGCPPSRASPSPAVPRPSRRSPPPRTLEAGWRW
jgi:hypothetical protein